MHYILSRPAISLIKLFIQKVVRDVLTKLSLVVGISSPDPTSQREERGVVTLVLVTSHIGITMTNQIEVQVIIGVFVTCYESEANLSVDEELMKY